MNIPTSASGYEAGNPCSFSRASVPVRQQDTRLTLDFEEGLEIQTAEPTASVVVRDKERVLEYAD